MDNLKVNCYSGHTYAERPVSFLWQGIEYEVREIERAWQEPGEKHFQVRTKDNKRFNLCYNETEKEWSGEVDYQEPLTENKVDYSHSL